MFSERPRPRLLRFLLVDPLTLAAWLILPTGWFVYAVTARLGYIPLGPWRLSFATGEVRWLLWGMGILTLLLLPAAVLGVRGFLLATANPVENRGAISRVDTHWWGRRIQFFYFSQGDKRHAQTYSLRNRWVMDLTVGDEVIVIFNQYRPDRAVLRGLYSGQEEEA